MMLRVGVVRPDRLDPWPDRSGQARGLSGRPDRPAGLRQPCMRPSTQPNTFDGRESGIPELEEREEDGVADEHPRHRADYY